MAHTKVAVWLFVVCLVIALYPTSGRGQAGAERVALVMGNSAYDLVPRLPNPTNDAAAMAEAFDRLGFSVTLIRDANAADMRIALRDFGDQAIGAEVAVIYYAGHGMEIGGVNYLVPTDARLVRDTDAILEAIPLQALMAAVGRASSLGLVILDACRNNPFVNMTRSLPTRAGPSRGLMEVEPTGLTYVAYSARDGTVAQDGPPDGHSPFTQALLAHIEAPGIDLRQLFGLVAEDVVAATGVQEPWLYGSPRSAPIYLGPPPGQPAAVASGGLAQDAVAAAYNAALELNTIPMWEAFLRYYPEGIYADFARARLEILRGAPANPVSNPNPLVLITPNPVVPQSTPALAPEPPTQPANQPFRVVRSLPSGNNDGVFNLDVSPDGRLILTEQGGVLYIWDMATGTRRGLISLARFSEARFLPDGIGIITKRDSDIRIWDFETASIRLSIHAGYPVRRFDVSADGRRLLTINDSGVGSAQLWDLETGVEVANFGPVRSVSFSNDGTRILTTEFGRAQVWNSTNGALLTTVVVEGTGYFGYAAFSPEGSQFAVELSDENYRSRIRLFDVTTGDAIKTSDIDTGLVGYFPDGERILAIGDDGSAQVWNIRTDERYSIDHCAYCYVELSPNGRWIVGLNQDRDVLTVWDASTGRELGALSEDSVVRTLGFSPDGVYLLTGYQDGTTSVRALSGAAP